MQIPVNRIIVNKQKISEEHVDDFVEILERGMKVKPITVRMHNSHTVSSHACMCSDCDPATDGEDWYVLVDGRHRLAAHKVLGREMIEVMVTL